MNGVISGLVYTLRSRKDIDFREPIVEDGLVGGVIYSKFDISRPQKTPNERADEFLEFLHLAKSLGSLDGCSEDFKMLVRCMKLADSEVKQLRLLKAPFFFNPTDKVHNYIPLMCDVAYINPEFCDLLANMYVYNKVGQIKLVVHLPIEHMYNRSRPDWSVSAREKALKSCHYEIPYMLDNPNFRYDPHNYFDFLRFVRNCTVHLHHTQRALKYEDQSKSMLSPLLVHPNLLLRFIDRVAPNFLNEIFRLTYKDEVGRLHMLDK